MKALISGRAAPVLYKPCVPSTNSELKAMAKTGAGHGTVLYAGRQTAGRGRMGRRFESPEGGLYLSILWRPEVSPEDCLRLTPCAAVAVSRCIETFCGIEPEIKWPNDLQIKGKKICGILTEGSFEAGGQFLVVLGIGLNVNNAGFPPELEGSASSLRLETGREFPIDRLAAELIRALDEMYQSCFTEHSLWLEEYRRRCNTIGADINMLMGDVKRPAKVLAVEDDYSLLLDVDGKPERKAFGEISIR